jgi:hypothetical protein
MTERVALAAAAPSFVPRASCLDRLGMRRLGMRKL